ncbi:hypothetical protein PTKIN_Ptkin14bG0093800 [Pterospermum kingtungense]
MNRGGIGVVVRDEYDQVLEALASGLVHVMDTLVAEAKAAVRTVDFGVQIGIARVSFEGDSLVVVNKICNPVKDLSIIGIIITDIKSRSKIFLSCVFSYANKTCNGVTDILAKYGAGVVHEKVWIDGMPQFYYACFCY